MAGCASCVFGAVSSTLLAFSYTAIEVLTVTIIPHVSVYSNGVRVTSNETITQPITEVVGSSSFNRSELYTYTNLNDITWTVDDATLTWPTTYVQYLGFQGAPLTTGQGCAQAAAATAVVLPTSTDPASFIYPLGADGAPLPTPLLEYLDQLDSVSSQFNGLALTGCAPLDGSPISARHEAERKQKRFEGARRNGGLNARVASSALINANRTSSEPVQSSTSSGLPSSTQITPSSSSALLSISASATLPSMSSSLVNNGGEGSASTSHSSPSANGPLTTSLGGITHLNQTCIMGNGTSNGNGTCHTMHPSVTNTQTRSPVTRPYHHTSAVGLHTITLPESVTTVGGSPPTNKHTSKQNTPGNVTPSKHTSKQHTPGKAWPSKHTSKHHSPGRTSNTSPSQKTPEHMHTPGSTLDPSPGGGDPTRHHRISPQTEPTGQHTGNGKSGPNPSGNGAPVFSLGTTKVTDKPGGVVIAQHTVHPGQKITFGSGGSKTTVALQTKGGTTRLVVDGTTYKPRPGNGVTPDPGSPTGDSPQVIITTNGRTFTAIRSGGSIVLGDDHSKTTIAAGAKITFEGQTISAPRHGTSIIVNGKPEPLTSDPEVVITAGGHVFTAVDESGSVVLEDGTLTMNVRDGSIVTFEGQTVSIGKHGTVIVVNGRTIQVTGTTQMLTGSASSSSVPAANNSAGIRNGCGISIWAVRVSCLVICFLFGVIAIL